MNKKSKYKLWWVIDDQDQTSYSARKEASEHFATRTAAQKRAVELANREPGRIFYVCEAIMLADAEVMPATYKTI